MHISGILKIAFLILLLFMPPMAQVEGKEDWPTFHHGLQRTGHTGDEGPSNASVLWTFETGDYVYSSPVYYQEKIYVGSGDNYTYCLNAENGSLIWRFRTGGVIQGTPSVEGERAFVPSYDGNLYCLDADSGEEIWNFSTQGNIFSSPAVAGNRVVFGSSDGNIYCLDGESGTQFWSFTTPQPVWASPAVDNGRVYIGSGTRFYCLNLDTGLPAWLIDLGESIIATAAVNGGRVFVATTGNNLLHAVYCLDSGNGMVYWRFQTPDNAGFFSSPALTGGRVVIGADNRQVYALNETDGSLMWNFSTGGVVSSSPAGAGDTVYVGSGDHRIYALDRASGEPFWSVETGDVVYSSPCVVDGRLWVGSWDHMVYCIGEDNTPGGGGQEGNGNSTSLRILEPNGVDDNADRGFRIEFEAEVKETNATVSFYYAHRRNESEALPIVENLSARETEYRWDTSKLQRGHYFILGVLTDGNTTLKVWSKWAVRVEHKQNPEDSSVVPIPGSEGVIAVFIATAITTAVFGRSRRL